MTAIRRTFVTVCGKHRAVMLNKVVRGYIGTAAVNGMKSNAKNIMSPQEIYTGFISN